MGDGIVIYSEFKEFHQLQHRNVPGRMYGLKSLTSRWNQTVKKEEPRKSAAIIPLVRKGSN